MNIHLNSDWEILTPSGWSDFASIRKSTHSAFCHIILAGGNEFKTSLTHKFKMLSGEFKSAIDLIAGDILYGSKIVQSVSVVENEIELYSIDGVALNEEYFADGVVHHNCAHIESIDTIWGASQAASSIGGNNVILLSTPNGVGNFFHKTWQAAEAGTNGFNPIKLDWRVHPDHDDAWRAKQEEILGPLLARQEHDADFLSSGNTVIPTEVLEFYNTLTEEPAQKTGFDGNLWIWEWPNVARSYILSADVARGDGGDKSAFHVIDAETCTQVAEYVGAVDVKTFANMLVAVGTQYNDALLIVENANHGWAVLQQVIDRNYNNLFYMTQDLHWVDVEQQYNNKFYQQDKKKVPGFTTSSRTRPLIISKLESYMRDKSVRIRSTRSMGEILVFIWKNGKAEAMSTYNDDLVMSLCIGLWVRDTALRLHQEGIELTRGLMDQMTNLNQSHELVYNGPRTGPDPFKISAGGTELEDISWLLR